MTETSRRGPYAKGVAKREEILREALAAYAESDSGGPSLRAVAARVGLSERGLLHYFASRDELFVSILEARDRADVALLPERATLDDLAAVPARSAKTPGLVRLFLEMGAAAPAAGHAAHDFFDRRYRRLRLRVAAVVAGPAEPTDDDRFVARMLIAASDGLQLQWLLDPDIDLQGDLQRLAALLRAGAR